MWSESRYGFWEASCGRVHFKGRAAQPQPGQAALVAYQAWSCRRHAFLWRQIMLVVEKLLVIHLQTHQQKTDT